MFAEGWVVYPRPRGSPEPTWHEARSASCQVGSGDPLVLGYTTQPSANILIFKTCLCISIQSMGQDPNFHISVPSGWAKLGDVFHVRIRPMHYLSHNRPLNSEAFTWLSPISIILFLKKTYFYLSMIFI